jgi:hypothetical protein
MRVHEQARHDDDRDATSGVGERAACLARSRTATTPREQNRGGRVAQGWKEAAEALDLFAFGSKAPGCASTRRKVSA